MIVAPKTAEEVAAFLAQRNSQLRIAYDSLDTPGVDTLSLANLSTVLAYEPEEMIVSVEAGISLTELESLLAAHGQWIPTLVAAENPESSLGAAIVNDHYHPRAASLGMLRTAILGGAFCTTDGQLFKSGSRVVKSVAGYDIHRAFCGSRGLFGAIVAVTLKVQPKPERIVRFTTSVDAREAIIAHSPSIVATLGDTLVVELCGYAEDVERSISELMSSGIELLDEAQWLESLRQSRASHTPADASPDVAGLLRKVRAVFDPKHILV